MRNLKALLAFVATTAFSAAALANEYRLPISDAAYDACSAKADLHLELARSAGYSLPTDLATIHGETFAACLEDAGLSAKAAKAEANYYFCDIVADLSLTASDPNGHGAYDLCESERAERLATRAP